MSISCYIGPSRPSGTLSTPPEGSEVPRPFDIKHTLRQVTGRSTGGAFTISKFESMDWIYAIGVDVLYNTFIDLYNPTNPWVWVHFPEIYSTEGHWYEAVMLEPKVTRSGGRVIGNLIVPFAHVVRYVP